MSLLIISVITVAFAAGLAVGVMWREAVELLLGRDDPVILARRTRATAQAVLNHRTTVATWAVVLAILVGVILGIGLALQHSDTNHLSRDAQAQVDCQRIFNHRTAVARHDRVRAQQRALLSEIRNEQADIAVWSGIRHLLVEKHATLHQALGVIDQRIHHGHHYLVALRHEVHVSRLHRYPPANFCPRPGGRR